MSQKKSIKREMSCLWVNGMQDSSELPKDSFFGYFNSFLPENLRKWSDLNWSGVKFGFIMVVTDSVVTEKIESLYMSCNYSMFYIIKLLALLTKAFIIYSAMFYCLKPYAKSFLILFEF